MTQLLQEETEASRTLPQGSGHWSAVASRKSDVTGQITQSSVVGDPSSVIGHPTLSVALLTGGGDKPYALGMAAALTSAGISVDFIGSDDLNVPEVVTNPRVNFLNLRGDQRSEASSMAKVYRVSRYYFRLIVTRRPRNQNSSTCCGTIRSSSSTARC